jgi:hypothetical protein
MGGDKDERKDRLTRVWGGIGGIVIAADTEFLRSYTLASYVLFGVGAIALIRALSFDLPLHLKQLRSAICSAGRDFRVARHDSNQNVTVLSVSSISRLIAQVIGIIAMLLPVVLIYGSQLSGDHTLATLSLYYYSPVRNILVGAFCALGVLLIFYTGNNRTDTLLASGAGLGCIGFALFPAYAAPARIIPFDTAPSSEAAHLVGYLHLFFVTQIFITLGVIAIRFALSDSSARILRMTHLICSGIIFTFLVLSYAAAFLPEKITDNVPGDSH